MYNTELGSLLSGSIRLYLISVLGQIIALYLCRYILKPRRPIWKLVLYLNLKSVFAIFILDIWLRYYFPMKEWVEFFGVTTGALLALGSCIMFTYTYEGGFVKCITGMTIAEIIMSIVMMPCMILANILAGKTDIFVFANNLHPVDIPVFVLEFGIAILIGKFLSPILGKFKQYDIRYKKLFTIAYFIYFFAAQIMTGMDLRSNSVFLFTVFGLYFICACCIMAAFYFIYWRYQKEIALKNDLLLMQMRLAEPHYMELREQVGKLEKCQQLIDEQIAELTRSDNAAEKKRKSAEYLQHLKEEYESIHAGMYCDDWMLDAVLHCQIEAAENCGISVKCLWKNVSYESRIAEKIGQILFLLFEFAIAENKNPEEKEKVILLKSGYIMNKISVEFQMTADGKARFPVNQIKELLRNLHGDISVTKKDRKITVLVTIPVQK